ncbi:MAG: response regulator [Chloroflexi bacterium]|nr:response regulator [Chloroflexota bacterium]
MESHKKKVLVVDDDQQLLDLLATVFQQAGYAVLMATGGREAIHQAVLGQPDVIVLDIGMPEMDGWEVAEHLLSHNQTAATPIIFLTALAGVHDQLRGWYTGCFDYVTKPFEIDHLLDRLRAAVNGPSEAMLRLRDDLRRQTIAALEAEERDLAEDAGMAPRRPSA